MPEPSYPSGYYESPILLELSAPSEGTIYYTTDGSIPNTDSNIYSDGIFVKNRSSDPNHYNAIQNLMTDWREYTPDPTPVAKGTVIRAIYVNPLGFTSDILTQTYFVGIPQPEQGYTLSLIFEEDDLFGENGICVTGSEYDNWYLSGDHSTPAPIPNFEKKTQVTVTAELINTNGGAVSFPVSLRLQGASMRGWIQKRFILEADSEITGSNLLPIEFFPNTTNHSLMTKGSVVDAMLHELVSDRAAATQKSVPVTLYLNGEFWYSWYFLERFDNHYFRQYYDVDNVHLVKNGESDEDIPPEESGYYGEMMYWLAHSDFTDEENWKQLKKEIDIQSYIDYISINYYLCNFDFSDYKNHVLWRSLYEESSPYGDKRWRWCLYDVDAAEFALRNYDVENAAQVNIFSDTLPYCDVKVNETVFFHAMRQNPEFCEQFVLSFMDIVNCNFNPARVSAILNKHGHTLDWMDGFFLKRPAYAAAHLAQEFNLSGSLETVTIRTSQPAMGTITVNTSTIDISPGDWSGQYFTDYPITVTAQPIDGYQFLGWKGDADTKDSTVTLQVDGGLSLEAVFAKIE